MPSPLVLEEGRYQQVTNRPSCHRRSGTHKDAHVAAVIDERGKILGTASFPASSAGYEKLRAWLVSFGTVGRVGVEWTGSYGAGITRAPRAIGTEVVEVNRPNR
ncbi:MAG: IS110 family transposase [Acidimicrobiales bacterium]